MKEFDCRNCPILEGKVFTAKGISTPYSWIRLRTEQFLAYTGTTLHYEV